MIPGSENFPSRAVVKVLIADNEWSSGFFFAENQVLVTAHGLASLRTGDPVELRRADGVRFDGLVRAFYPNTWDRAQPFAPFPDCAVVDVPDIAHATPPPIPLPLRVNGQMHPTRTAAAYYGFNIGYPEGTYRIAEVLGYQLITGTLRNGYRLESDVPAGTSGSPVFTEHDGEVFAVITSQEGAATPIDLIAGAVPEVAAAIRSARVEIEIISAAVPEQAAMHAAIAEGAFVDAFLRATRERARAGNTTQALTDLQAIINGPAFVTLDANAQGAYLRLAATLTIAVHNDIPAARELLERARPHDPAAATIVEARLLLAEGNLNGAIELLHGRNDAEAEVTRISALYFGRRRVEGLRAAEEAHVRHPEDRDVARFLALLLLANGRRTEALAVARAVHDADPASPQARWTLAVVLYHTRLPDDLIPWAADGPPAPPPPDMLTSSPESLPAEVEAARLFAEVLAMLDAASDQKHASEVWWLGALVLANRDDEAARAAQAALERTPPNPDVVPWILAYDLAVDLGPWLDETRARAESGSASTGEILAYAQVDIVRADGAEAERLLEVSRAQFEAAGLDVARRVTSARAHAKRRDFAGALEVLGDADLRFAEALRNVADNREVSEIRQAAFESFERTGDGTYLLEAVEAAMRQGDAAWAATQADELVNRLPTAAAVAVSLAALFNAGRLGDWERLFDVHMAVVAADDRVIAMHVAVLGRTSRWPDAAVIARGQVANSPTAANISRLAYVQEQLADHDGMAETARIYLEAGAPDPALAIQIAVWLQASHSDIAGRLWDAAMALGVPLEAVPAALSLAHALGRDDRTGTLAKRMPELVEHGIATSGTLEDLRVLMQDRRALVTDLTEQYRNGEVAIHVLADVQNFPILHSHLAVPRQNESAAPARWTPIYTRHIGRIAVAGADLRAITTLAIDVTSLHVLFALDLLDEVEARWPDIVVARHLGEITRGAERHYHSSQPALDAARSAVIALVDLGQFRVFDAPETADPMAVRLFPYLDAENDDGVVVDWGPMISPVTGDALDPQPDVVDRRGIDAWALVEALRNVGELTAAQAATALARLGPNRPPTPRHTQNIHGRSMRLDGNLGEWLQDAGILEPLRRIAGTISVDGRMLAIMRASTEEAVRARELGATARAFVNHCAARLQSGAYRAAVAVEGFDALPATAERPEGNREALFDILSADVGAHGAIVVDDQFANQWPIRERTPIVSVLDLVHALHLDGVFDEARFYQILLAMRAQALFFIPLHEAELFRAIQAAQVVDGALAESAELRIIRRYTAFAISALHAGPTEGVNVAAERAFASATSLVIRNALIALYDTADPDAELRARWIIYSLWFDDLAAYSPLPREMPNLPPDSVADMAAGALFVNVLMSDDAQPGDAKGPNGA